MAAEYHPVDIGELHIDGNIFAAPMAGYTDRVSRYFALNEGANLAFTEMISAEALLRNSSRTHSMMKRGRNEKILAVQLFGSSPERLGMAAKIAAERGADLLDLNAGCPVSKVTAKGAGAALGRDIPRLRMAVREMRAAGLPLTVKIRSGWDETELNWREAAAAVREEGASAVGFHPRTRKQGYGGKADWNALKELTAELDIPVIGSGDLDSPRAVYRMLEETECGAVMIARGAVGNPEIFRQSRSLLVTGSTGPTSPPVKHLENALIHLKAAAEIFGEEKAARDMKKHLSAYLKGWPSASALRNELMRIKEFSLLTELIEEEIEHMKIKD